MMNVGLRLAVRSVVLQSLRHTVGVRTRINNSFPFLPSFLTSLLSPGASLKVVSFCVLQRFWVSFMKIDPDQDEVRKSITCLEMVLLHRSPSTPKAVAVTLSEKIRF